LSRVRVAVRSVSSNALAYNSAAWKPKKSSKN
jgi:hypothetical protein